MRHQPRGGKLRRVWQRCPSCGRRESTEVNRASKPGTHLPPKERAYAWRLGEPRKAVVPQRMSAIRARPLLPLIPDQSLESVQSLFLLIFAPISSEEYIVRSNRTRSGRRATGAYGPCRPGRNVLERRGSHERKGWLSVCPDVDCS